MAKQDAKSALTSEEVGRRVRLAREYAGYERRKDLEAELERRQFPYSRLGRIERGEQNLLDPMRDALVTVLGFPRAWFTAPLDALLQPEPDREPSLPPALEARLSGIEETLRGLSADLGDLLLDAVERGLESAFGTTEEDQPNGRAADAAES